MDMRWYPAAKESGVVGRFEYLDLLDVPASREADEPRTKRIIVLREKVTASTDDTVRKVRPENQAALVARFPDAWKAFSGEEVAHEGTPLGALGLNETRILEFRLHAVTSVEQLAALSDAQCQAVGFGTRKLRDEAKALLAGKSVVTPVPEAAETEEPAPARAKARTRTETERPAARATKIRAA